ncbi:MAG: glycosyltransferase [Alphaproteobacteria bacterium]|nr:glycosyltransferase [Alphaproteobacteria bacterium]
MSRPFLLIVTRHYPPEVSGGARRPFLIAHGLRDRGYRVVVASPFAPDDEPDWIRTPHPAALRGFNAASKKGEAQEAQWKSKLRRMVRWPDNEIAWAGHAVRAVLASKLRPDWILTTSPPESAHAAGERLKRALGARWMLEMRDSWIEEPLRAELALSGLRQSLERGIARRWLETADARVAVSEALSGEMKRLGPGAASPLSVIGHFAEPAPVPAHFEGPGPHFLHAGSLSQSHFGRRLGDLLAAFSTLLAKMPAARLHLVGRLTPVERAELAVSPIAGYVTYHGEVSYAQSRALQAGADGLILYQKGIDALPGKLGEYLECTAPILTIGEGSWKSRLEGLPHWELVDADEALRAPRRTPANALTDTLDMYEAVLGN